MATETVYRHGDPIMVDYTPSSGSIAAGQVILIGNTTGWTCGIAHVPIDNNTQGAIACGGGVYDVVNLDNAATGVKVYWDDSTNKVTTTSTNNSLFGFIVSNGGGGANTTARALHRPYV